MMYLLFLIVLKVMVYGINLSKINNIIKTRNKISTTKR